MNRRNGNNRRDGRNKDVRYQITQLKHRMNGVKLTCSPDVPAITAKPWYPLTVRFLHGATSPFLLSVNSVRSAVGTQLEITTNAIEIRFIEVRSWGVLGGGLTLNVFDPTDTSTSGVSLMLGYDNGTTSARPRLGYLYPERVASTVIDSGDSVLSNGVVTVTFDAPSGFVSAGETHVRLLWRTNSAST
jgi:hypothetical protein